MKKYLNSPEQVLIALKLGKVVYKKDHHHLHYKIVEGVVCAFANDTKECVLINAQIFWLEDYFYVIEK